MGKFFGIFLVKGITAADAWGFVLGLIGLLLIVGLIIAALIAIAVGCMLAGLYLMDLYENMRFWCWRKWGIKLPESWLGSTDKADVSKTSIATESGASGSKKVTRSTRMMRGLILVSVLLIVIVCICI